MLSYKMQSLEARLKRLEKENRGLETFPDFNFFAYGNSQVIQTLEDSEVLLSGGAGTGKSTACLAKIHKTCLENPHVRALIVRKTRSSLAETALHSFESTILGFGHPLLSGATRQNRRAYVYPNGSRIVVGGMDSPSRIMSSDYDIIFAQEATELTEEDWDNLLSRLRNYKLPYQQIMGDCNPQGENHWLYRRSSRKSLVMLQSRHEDNPVMYNPETGWTAKGKEYLAKLDNLSGVRYKRLREGIWASAEGAVYDMFDAQAHIFYGHLPTFRRYIVGMDFGYTNAGTMLTFGETVNGDLFLVDEVYRTGQTLDWWVNTALQVNARYRPQLFIGDPARPDAIKQLQVKGLNVKRGNNKIKFGVDLVQRRLQNKSIKFYHNSLKEEDKELKDNLMPLRVTDEILGYMWDENKDVPIATQNHALDAMRYVVAEVDKVTSNILPATSQSISTMR